MNGKFNKLFTRTCQQLENYFYVKIRLRQYMAQESRPASCLNQLVYRHIGHVLQSHAITQGKRYYGIYLHLAFQMYARLALFVGRQTRFVQLKRLFNDYALLQFEGTVSLPLFLFPYHTRATNTDRDIISHELQDQTCTTDMKIN